MSASVLAEPKSDSNGGDQIPWTTGCNVISPAASVDAPVDVTGAANGWLGSRVGRSQRSGLTHYVASVNVLEAEWRPHLIITVDPPLGIVEWLPQGNLTFVCRTP